MKSFFKTAAVIVLTAAVSVSGTIIGCGIYHNISVVKTDERGSSVSAKLDMVNEMLDKEYLYDDYDQSAMDEMAVQAYVEGLDEPYTHYYPPEEFASYMSDIEDSYVGIGVVISADEESGKIVIVSPTENSPAYNAGLLPGDYIIAVDGTEYPGDKMDECVAAIKNGEEGTTVKLTIEHNGETRELEIERARISAHSVSGEMLNDDTGYIRISAFNTNDAGSEEDTYTEFVDELETLQGDGMEKLVIDLRDNPGGILNVVCDIADYILPEGIITYTETKTGKRTEYKSDSSEIDIPMVVLINGGSASASEILTGALKDYGRAEIVGERSFGKGIVQTVHPFSDGSGMSMTIAKYYTPNGVCIHGEGIAPDYEVTLPERYKDTYASAVPHDEDTQLQKALELLK